MKPGSMVRHDRRQEWEGAWRTLEESGSGVSKLARARTPSSSDFPAILDENLHADDKLIH